jgi:general stress protein 26
MMFFSLQKRPDSQSISPMEINYDELAAEAVHFLDQHNILVFATASADRVTARAMSCVHIGLAIYFQTSNMSVKYQQIVANPKVALCAGNMQLEGLAAIRKHPLESVNAEFRELYQRAHPGFFKAYSHLPAEVVIAVEPHLMTFWKYTDDHKPYREFLHVLEHRAVRVEDELNNTAMLG